MVTLNIKFVTLVKLIILHDRMLKRCKTLMIGNDFPLSCSLSMLILYFSFIKMFWKEFNFISNNSMLFRKMHFVNRRSKVNTNVLHNPIPRGQIEILSHDIFLMCRLHLTSHNLHSFYFCIMAFKEQKIIHWSANLKNTPLPQPHRYL